MRQIELLNINRNDIGDSGLIHLAEASYMSNLTQLYLDDNNIGTSGVCALASSKFITKLTLLSLKNNNVGNDAFNYLLISNSFDSL